MLSLTRTRSVTTEELERVAGTTFSAERFASLCNALALATRGPRLISLVALDEHVMSRTEGIDPDWQVELYSDRDRTLPLLRPGLNWFECRRVGFTAQGARNGFSELLSRVRGAVDGIARRTSRQPTQYVLCTNLRLGPPSSAARRQLERSVLLGYSLARDVRVEILGAEELTDLVNRTPHVRSVFFEQTGLELWRDAWREHARPKLFGDHVDLVGRQTEIAELRSCLGDRAVRIITLSGPAGIGKTRLALEATVRWARDVVVVNSSNTLQMGDLAKLKSPDKEVVVIVENCDDALARQITQTMALQGNFKFLLLLTTAGAMPAPVRGAHDAVRNLAVGPLSWSHARELVRAAVTGLDEESESWIVREASGNPGNLLAAAGLRLRPRRGIPSFQDALVRNMEVRIRNEFGERGYRILSLLSLLTRVELTEQGSHELRAICGILGNELQPTTVLQALPAFRDAGVVRQTGRELEVVPTVLANDLSLEPLRERPERAGALIGALGSYGRLRVAGQLPRRALSEEEPEVPVTGEFPGFLASLQPQG